MAEDASHQYVRPPRAAAALLAFVLRGSNMAALIGDLDEEYAQIAHGSPKAARRWYWRQSALSTVHVAIERAREENLHRALIGLATVFLFLNAWNFWVAPGAATQVYALTNAGSYMPARVTYFLVVIAGTGLAGAFFSRVAATMSASLDHFMVMRVTPAVLLLFSPSVMKILTAGDGYPVTYRLSLTGLAAAAFAIGAAFAFWRMRNRP